MPVGVNSRHGSCYHVHVMFRVCMCLCVGGVFRGWRHVGVNDYSQGIEIAFMLSILFYVALC